MSQMKEVEATRQEICESCGDTNCAECQMSFIRNGVRIFIKNKKCVFSEPNGQLVFDFMSKIERKMK